VRVEIGEERRVLGQELLELGGTRSDPVFDPGLLEVILDAMEAALAHGRIIEPGSDGSRHNLRMPRSSATLHELNRIGLLAGLPGETLQRLAKAMEREEVAPGTVIMREGDAGDRFYVVFAGMLSVTQTGFGDRTVLRPGDYFGEVALAMDFPRTATVAAITPCVVASCDRETFDELIRPLFADD
jgi:CRP-like cAMP-binding protein